MIKWIDVVSPTLRDLHKTWIEMRGPQMMAGLRDYNRFVGHAPPETSLAVIVPIDGGSPLIKHAGESVMEILPVCRNGITFAEMPSPTMRAIVAGPIHQICTSRQPDCRRGAIRTPFGAIRFEQLLLPFANDRLKVCVVHSIYDLSAPERRGA